MLRVFIVWIFIGCYLNAHILGNSNSMGRGGVDMAMGGSSSSVLVNPSNLKTLHSNNDIKVEPINSSIALNGDTLNFLKELSSHNDAQKVSELMKENIGETLSFHANNFASIYKNNPNYSWLLGLYYNINGYFITHSGFGSRGAMDSYVEQYKAMVSTLSFHQNSIDYGFNIRAIDKQQTIHSYSVREIIENDSIIDYLDNKYSKNDDAIALDMGVSYKLPNNQEDTKVALSILNIGDTDFGDIGSIPSTTNIGFSSKYQGILYGMDYIDLFGAEDSSSFKDSMRFGVSRFFLKNSLTLSSGILYESLTFGIDYQYSIFDISLSSYREKDHNFVKNRKYQLSISITW
jgi:hypothetical protein